MTIIRPMPAFSASLNTRRVFDFDAAVGVDDDHRRIDAAQRADRLADEVGIAGRVDDVEVFAGVLEVRDARFDRVLVVLSLRRRNRRCSCPSSTLGSPLTAPVLTSSLSTSVVLPQPPWPHKSNVADVFHLVLRHARRSFVSSSAMAS